MFKRAYVRGVLNHLVQAGRAEFPNAEASAKVADYIADNVGIDPLQGPVTADDVVKVANFVITASNELKQKGYQPEPVSKIASVEDLSKHAHVHALDLMEKAASESGMGGTVGGPSASKGNHAAITAEGKMDPRMKEDYATSAHRGETERKVPVGAQVGKEEKPLEYPGIHPTGTNSAVEMSNLGKTGSLSEMISKLADGMGATVGGASASKGNHGTLTSEGKMDIRMNKNYALLPHQGAGGAIPKLINDKAVVGREIILTGPDAPMHTTNGGSPNSAILHSQKAASEDPYLLLFKKVASEVVPHLPAGLDDDTKVAHIRSMMGLTTEEQAHYITGLQKQAAAQTVGPAPAPSNPVHVGYDGKNANQRKVAEEETAAEEKKEEKAEAKVEAKAEEKAEEKKEASLTERLRAISQAVQTANA